MEANEAPKQVVALWGALPTVGYLLVRHGATDKIMLNVHVELKRRSATMLSGLQVWQDTFFYRQQIVASQILIHLPNAFVEC